MFQNNGRGMVVEKYSGNMNKVTWIRKQQFWLHSMQFEQQNQGFFDQL